MTIELTLSTSLLIAHPQLEGEFFARSVIYLVNHIEEGSFGFVINRPSDFSLGDLIGEACPEIYPPFNQWTCWPRPAVFLHLEANISVTEPSTATVLCDVSAAAPKRPLQLHWICGLEPWSTRERTETRRMASRTGWRDDFDCPVEDRYQATLPQLGFRHLYRNAGPATMSDNGFDFGLHASALQLGKHSPRLRRRLRS